MRISKYLFLLGGFGLLIASCQKDSDQFEPVEEIAVIGYPDVLTDLWSYFESFEAAAAQRGVQVDLNQAEISAEITPIEAEGVAGSCSYGSHTPGHIVIDEEFWNAASTNFREMIVFHELGHCSLFLGHREGSHPNGTCLSIMRSGLEDCRDNYNRLTREAYLDELFTTP